jgi:hypothetical protein
MYLVLFIIWLIIKINMDECSILNQRSLSLHDFVIVNYQ